MAEERNFFQKLLNPTEEEKRKIIEGIEEGRKYSRILDKEGFKGLITRIAEQEALDQGQTEEEVLQNMNADAPLCKKCDPENQIVKMEKQVSHPQRPKFNCSGFYETDYKMHKNRKEKSEHNYKVRRSQGKEHIDPLTTNYEGGQIPLSTKHDKRYGKRKIHKPKK